VVGVAHVGKGTGAGSSQLGVVGGGSLQGGAGMCKVVAGAGVRNGSVMGGAVAGGSTRVGVGLAGMADGGGGRVGLSSAPAPPSLSPPSRVAASSVPSRSFSLSFSLAWTAASWPFRGGTGPDEARQR